MAETVKAHPARDSPSDALRATLFGSGRHETTQGCLHALGWLARRRRVRVAFDIGTGSGILAVAAARLPGRLGHADIDAVSRALAETPP